MFNYFIPKSLVLRTALDSFDELNYVYVSNDYKVNAKELEALLPSMYGQHGDYLILKHTIDDYDYAIVISTYKNNDSVEIYSPIKMTRDEVNNFIEDVLNGKKVDFSSTSSTTIRVLIEGMMGSLHSRREQLRTRSLNHELFETFDKNEFEKLKLSLKEGGMHILYGPPGTGKTSVISTLAKELEGEVEFYYPMTDVVKDIKGVFQFIKDKSDLDHIVLILEDKDDLLTKIPGDMLDVSDGIMSLLGNKTVSLLITSNKEGDDILNGIHEGLKRPGRLNSFIEMPEYSDEFGQDLQIAEKLSKTPKTLAEYYKLKKEQ